MWSSWSSIGGIKTSVHGWTAFSCTLSINTNFQSLNNVEVDTESAVLEEEFDLTEWLCCIYTCSLMYCSYMYRYMCLVVRSNCTVSVFQNGCSFCTEALCSFMQSLDDPKTITSIRCSCNLIFFFSSDVVMLSGTDKSNEFNNCLSCNHESNWGWDMLCETEELRFKHNTKQNKYSSKKMRSQKRGTILYLMVLHQQSILNIAISNNQLWYHGSIKIRWFDGKYTLMFRCDLNHKQSHTCLPKGR